MKTYTITSGHSAARTYKRRDHAAYAFLHAVYDQLAAFGLLDTKHGHALYGHAKNVADSVASGVFLDFSHAEPNGPRYTIRVEE